MVVKEVDASESKVLIEKIEERELHESTEWIRTASWVNLVLTANFVRKQYRRNTIGFKQFVEAFTAFTETIKEKDYVFPPLSFLYVYEGRLVFRFLVYSGSTVYFFKEIVRSSCWERV